MAKIVPFSFYRFNHSNDDQCPGCSRFATREAVHVCSRGIGNLWLCPTEEHFHRRCDICKKKWLEGTYEGSNDGRVALQYAFGLAHEYEWTEDDIMELWRTGIMKAVIDS